MPPNGNQHNSTGPSRRELRPGRRRGSVARPRGKGFCLGCDIPLLARAAPDRVEWVDGRSRLRERYLARLVLLDFDERM